MAEAKAKLTLKVGDTKVEFEADAVTRNLQRGAMAREADAGERTPKSAV